MVDVGGGVPVEVLVEVEVMTAVADPCVVLVGVIVAVEVG